MYPQVAKQHAAEKELYKDEKSLTGLAPPKRQRPPKPAQLTFTGFAAKFINRGP